MTMILTHKNRIIQNRTITGGIYAEDVPGVIIRNVEVRGGPCNIHLVRCHGARISSVFLRNPEISADDGDEHGKGILLDHCNNAEITDVRAECEHPSGDGINLCGCRKGKISHVTIIGPKRRDKLDTAVGLVLDAGSRDCTVDDVTVECSDPPAMTVLGRGHVIDGVNGLVQVGRDGAKPGVRDVTLRHCQAWVASTAQGITFGEGARRSQ